jgi:hypothetical protein
MNIKIFAQNTVRLSHLLMRTAQFKYFMKCLNLIFPTFALFYKLLFMASANLQ